MEKNTRTPLSRVSSPMELPLRRNQESPRFISPNSQEKFRNAFIMTRKRLPHILPSRPQITPHTKSSRKRLDVNELTRKQRTTRFWRHNKPLQIAHRLCRPA